MDTELNSMQRINFCYDPRPHGKWIMTLALLKDAWLHGETTMHISPGAELIKRRVADGKR